MGNPIIKAGGVVIKREGGSLYVLLVYRKKQDDWSFPKGHVEQGEEIKETALREIKEETGISVSFVEELEQNKYTNGDGKDVIANMYLLKPLSLQLKPEHEGDMVEWIRQEEVIGRLSYENLREYFRKIENKLR